ncbi:MAG: Asp23/Gls24 family envelope stress response protein [Candidatus Omnitrophota bacterium]
MNRNVNSEYGQIKIHRKVLVQVAETAARQVKGVEAVGWACYGWLGPILRFFNWAGTRVKFENEIRIVIPITVFWEVNIVDLAYEVQKKIITQMLNGLNIDSVSVDVKVKKVKRG